MSPKVLRMDFVVWSTTYYTLLILTKLTTAIFNYLVNILYKWQWMDEDILEI